MFSNLLFAFAFHGAIPAIFTSIKSEEKIKSVLINVFAISGLSFLLCSYLGIMAFGTDLCDPFSKSDIKYFHLNF